MKQISDILNQSPENIVKAIKASEKEVDRKEISAQYDPSMHDVMISYKRKNKRAMDGKGGVKEVSVARLSIPFQKIIVNRAVAFLFTNPVSITLADQTADDTALTMIQYLLKKNKSSSLNREIARALFSETEVAEYWYPVEDKAFWKKAKLEKVGDYRLRCRIFSPSRGDTLYPVFDEFDDMVAFGRGYTIVEGEKNVKTEYLDLFTNDFIKRYKKDKELGWIEEISTPNILSKIPVVYYSQEEAEWSDVQSMIDRLETLISNFADTNDYFGSPMVKVKGTVTGFAEKGEQGKVITVSEGGDAEYLTWSNAPDTIKLEIDTLQNFIYSMTQTPDISFKAVQGITNISGIALKLLFLDAYLKAQNKLEIFDEAMTRRLSILKSYCSKFNVAKETIILDTEIEAVITPYIPENLKETIEMLSAATGGKQILSQSKAVSMTGLADDAVKEMEEISKELVNTIGETFV
ncbi:MAG: phage portal protein [Lentimicrobium sp.]|nr:phage portal protein [Lentimicrobium sp.]